MLTSVVPINTANSIKLEFAKRSDFDFNKRSILGIAFYVLAWPLLFLAWDFHHKEPVFCWLMALNFLLVSIARYHTSKIPHDTYEQNPHIWRVTYIAMLFSHALLWSFLCFVANFDPIFQELQVTINILSAGIASASVNSLSCKHRVAQFYICIILLPINIFLFTGGSTWPLALMLLFFWVYLMLVCHRSHEEYLRSFNIEWSLLEKQQELRAVSQTDFLTKAHNRLFFNDYIAQQWFLAKRNQHEIALLMIDLDHFKTINDQHGHLFGDACLVHAANVIRSIVRRKSDTLIRFGGEEFLVVLPETNIQTAQQIAEHICRSLCAEPFQVDHAKTLLTASIGVCAILPDSSDHKVLLHQADEALYKAKRNGRNRVEIAELNQSR